MLERLIMDNSKAEELINQIERHQQEQIQCLRALLSLIPEDKANLGESSSTKQP